MFKQGVERVADDAEPVSRGDLDPVHRPPSRHRQPSRRGRTSQGLSTVLILSHAICTFQTR